MSDVPALSILTLAPEMDADDAVGLRDQIAARILALAPPKGRKRAAEEIALPAGVQPMEKLPPHLDLAWKRFDAAVGELQAFRHGRAVAKGDEAHSAGDENERNAANLDSDDRWRAFERWSSGAAGLSDDGAAPSPREAQWLHAQLFPPPDGLRFITRRPRAQWAAMEQRMKLLLDSRAQAVIEGFGGGRHYTQLQAAHARFGKAFGFTTAVIETPGGPTDGRPLWVTARDALRVFLQRVESHADEDIEGTEALASFLLAPYVEMLADLDRTRRARGKKAEPAPAAPAGAPVTP